VKALHCTIVIAAYPKAAPVADDDAVDCLGVGQKAFVVPDALGLLSDSWTWLSPMG
jgi:hypothetical protein